VGSCAGTLPSYPKGIPDDNVAAGGCPAPFRRNGVRRLSEGAASRRGAGLTADLPQCGGERAMKGKPSAPEPCRQQTVRGPRPEGIPRRGASGSPGT
jgi:hypothetical protein